MDVINVSRKLMNEVELKNLNIRDISNDTGISYNPLYRFLKGAIEQPKVNIVMTLIDYLKISPKRGAEILGIDLKNDYLVTDSQFYNDQSNRTVESLIKEKMQKLGIKNKDLALRVDVSPSYLSRILSTSNSSNLSIILDLCKEIHVGFEELQWCYNLIPEYPLAIAYGLSLEDSEVNESYNCNNGCVISPIKALKRLHPNSVGRFLVITFNTYSANNIIKGYMLSSEYCTFEIGVLVRDCVKYMENLTNVDEGTIDLFQKDSDLSARKYLEIGSSLHVYSPLEFCDKMKQLNAVDRFPVLYCILKHIDFHERKELNSK